MASRVFTGYQVGLGVLCALGLGLAIWLTSTDPTITYSTPGTGRSVEVVCSSGTDVLQLDEKPASSRERSYAINVDCARAERARLRTIVWVLAGVLAVGVVLMGTVIIRISRRRHTR
ncbi:MAG: hypothetical protein L0K86_10950 [Actinomycetia bacterium]|nr:hypothetical protein [Actinomycetes bacterium]